MALTKITKTGLTSDIVDETLIADNAISEEHLDNTAITGHTELSATAADDDVLLVFDTSSGTIKKIQSSNVGITPPTFSSVSPTNLVTGDGTGNFTIVVTGTKFDANATFKLRTDGGTDISMDSVTRDSVTQLTGTVAKNTSNLTNANEPFDIIIENGNGLQATALNQINIDAQPAYTTAAGSLGSFAGGSNHRIEINATDPESAGNVTFELQSGSLPAGMSLTTEGGNGGTAVISGTATNPSANTTSNFVLRAVDAASNTTSRAFSITITRTFTTQSFTSSGTFAVPSGVSQLSEVLVVAGGGSGATTTATGSACGGGGGGGGAGGLVYFPAYPVSGPGTITVTVGCGGTHPNGAQTNGVSGQDSVFGASTDPGFSPTSTVLTAKGGGGGGRGNINGGASGTTGGSGGGGGNGPSPGGAATQPTQPGNSGAYGFGNPGGRGGKQPSYNHNNGAGGGGGAGAAAADWWPTSPGGGHEASPGGIGKAYTIADGSTSVYYAGGGGGGYGASCTSFGGLGGGGGSNPACNPGDGVTNTRGYPTIGAPYPAPNGEAMSGDANKGGGGAGTGDNLGPVATAAGDGGKGVVIVRY